MFMEDSMQVFDPTKSDLRDVECSGSDTLLQFYF